MSTLHWQIVFVTLPIALLTLHQCVTATQSFQTLPSLEAFATYEDMQRYFTQRNQRSFRHIGNPSDDTYIEAFNQYNEQLEDGASAAPHLRTKRAQQIKKLPTEPKLLRFEVADAVEPNEELKALIRQHRARAEQLNESSTQTKTIKKIISNTESTKVTTEVTTTKPKRSPRFKTYRKPRRSRRSVLHSQQPVNFKVQWIPFEASDAREPDEKTRQLIKQMRALDLDRVQSQAAQNVDPPEIESTSTSLYQAMQTRSKPYKLSQRKAKRIKRSTQPEMIKFELSDAKEPTELLKSQLQLQKDSQAIENVKVSSTTAPTLLTMEMQINETTTKSTVSQPKLESRIGRTDAETGDSDTHESRRLYVYKEAPKSKKIINTLPHEVQKVITHMFKDNQGGKAYVKYIPSQKLDHDQLKSYYNAKLIQPIYGVKLHTAQQQQGHLKYVIPKPESVQVHVQPVPVVEKLRYVYTSVPVYHAAKYAQIAQPIIVPETAHQEHAAQVHAAQVHTPTEIVHHTYSAELAPPPPPPPVHQQVHQQQVLEHQAHQQQLLEQQAHEQQSHEHQSHEQQAQQEQHQHIIEVQQQPELIEVKNIVQEIPSTPFRPSKPDPLLDEIKLPEATSFVKTSFGIPHIKPIEHYKYEIHSQKVEDYEKPQLQLLSHHHHHQYIQQQSLPKPQPQHAQPPLIKIEYHAPPDPLKENYKNLPEFKELSTLIGKSPDDQIHGLTYLIAKEMQNKLQRQAKQVELVERPQDNKAPILFHQIQPQVPQPNLKAHVDHAAFGSMKQYVPIVENNDDGAGKTQGGATEILTEVKYLPAKGEEPKAPEPSSFVEYEHGLSSGYDVVADKSKSEPTKLTTVEHVIHHPTVSHHGYLNNHYGLGRGHHSTESVGSGESSGEHKGSTGGVHYNINHSDSSKLQYASKYAFGYRIRDFNTGNDFGHKQNRDLNGVTRGQYHILLPDGRIQNVIYHADDTGFHADVSFESGH